MRNICIMMEGGLGLKCLLLWDFGIGVELTRFLHYQIVFGL
jgi:hypothetical protein